MSELISIRVLSAIYLRGELVAAGTVIDVLPIEAAECCSIPSRCEYVFPEDRETAIAAARAADAKACAKQKGVRGPAWAKEWGNYDHSSG